MSDPRTGRLPNFILAGAPTSGTTSLHHYLSQHPQVFMSPVKEPTFFASADMLARDDFLRVIKRDQAGLKAYLDGPQARPGRYWVTEWNDYVRLFRNARDQIAIGEGSVSYIWLPSAAPAIQTKLPGVKLIFMLRDPADRLFSWYLMRLRAEPNLTLGDQLRREMQEGDPGATGLLRQLDGGMYSRHLRRFLDLFPRDQVRIYLYDDYRADARAVLRDVFAFLEVNPDQPIDLSYRHNETMLPRFPALHGLRRHVFGDFTVTQWLPAALQHTLQGFYNRPRGHQAMDPDNRRLVIDYYRDEILRTQDLIGRDLSAWLR
jgi:hypothetical protein